MFREAWALAIETLSWMQIQKLSERLALARTLKQLEIQDSAVERFAHVLVYETIRRQNFIDRFIHVTLKPNALVQLDRGQLSFLRLYVYQTQISRNWSRIDIKEAEKIARLARSILGWKSLQEVEPFLGALLTQKPTTVFENVADVERIGLRTFYPSWFVKYCFNLFGRIQTIAMFEADLEKLPTYIRLNSLKLNESEILEKLEREGIKAKKTEPLRHTYEIIEAKVPLTETESYKEGLFYVQDKASCLATEAADPKPGAVVLEACATSIAKTTYLAQLMQNHGSIYSVDYTKHEMGLWRARVARMGAEIAQLVVADMRSAPPLKLEADLVVLDPPSTCTGTFRKTPSAKWNLTPRSIDKMAEIQWQMLNNCARNVKNGGSLIYSTRTITVEENELQIEKFLKWNPEFSLVEVEPKIGWPGLRTLEKCQRLYTNIHRSGGFFVAKLQKTDP